jgi:hypothetical protein
MTRFYSAAAPALIVNVILWWVYLAQDDRGFPWPIFVTVASIGGVVAAARRDATGPSEDGRQRNRNRDRDRAARRSGRP